MFVQRKGKISMTNDQELIKKLTKEIGNKKNTELKVGKIYLSKEDVKNGFEPYKGVGNIFDVSSHNFHLVLDISESEKNKIYIEKYTNHIQDMREKIIDVLKEKGFITINSSEYKKRSLQKIIIKIRYMFMKVAVQLED